MSYVFKPAIREEVGLLIGLIGPSGAGKTFSAMRLASGIVGQGNRFAVIDTESRRALHYADMFQFDHLELGAPFRPKEYADAIQAADKAGYKAIVVDSFSHEWAGEGGILDWQEEELSRMAGDDWKKREACKMASWIKPKMGHKQMVQRLLQVKANLILCFRADEKAEMVNPHKLAVTEWQKSVEGYQSDELKTAPGRPKPSQDTPDKTIIRSKGWQPICSKELPYELTVSFLLDPDKPGIPRPIKLQKQHRDLFPFDKPINEESGRLVSEWAKGGAKKESVDQQTGEVADHPDKQLSPFDQYLVECDEKKKELVITYTKSFTKTSSDQIIEKANKNIDGFITNFEAWLNA